MRHATWGLLVLLVSACAPEEEAPPPIVEREPAPPVEDPPASDTDVEMDCELTVSPEAPWVVPSREVRFGVTGGSGAPVFEFADNGSGALLDEQTGAYLSGERFDVVDRVRITDPACPGEELLVDITVAPNLAIEPQAARLLPRTVVTPLITGGSSEVRCRLDGADTGSSLDDCVYTAGDTPGRERLIVEDLKTGDTVSAELRIDPNARLESLVGHWGGVVGEPVHPELSGGSGHYTLEVRTGGATITEDGGVTATAAGPVALRAVDRYVGLSLDLSFDALEVIVPDHVEASGERTDVGRLFGGEDLNGDGYEDLVFLHPEASGDTILSGVASVFAGSATGLQSEPTQRLSGRRWGRLGYGAALADFNGDGQLDLAAGQIYDQITNYQEGSLAVYHGVSGGFFEDEPAALRHPRRNSARMGIAVGACDLDADGYDDAIVSAYQDRDPDAEAGATYQGVVYAYRGGPSGVEETPSWTLYGVIPDGEGWTSRPNLRFGVDIVTGDLNDDGRCDVAISALQGVRRESGYGSVFVYFGLEGGGLGEHPDVVLDHDDAGDSDGRFGRRMAIAEIDGQPGEELIVGGDGIEGGGRTRGTVALYDGQTLVDAQGETLTLDDAVWRADGGLNWDRLGWGIATIDLDDDGVEDLLVGAHSDELSGGARDTGVAYVWSGGDLRADIRRGVEVARSPSLSFAHGDAYTRLGTALTAVDADNDGERELVALAPRDNGDATWGGALYIVDSPSSATRIGLQREVHLTYIGLGLAWAEDERGSPTLLIGAPQAVSDRPRYRGGQVWAAPRRDLQDTRVRLPVPPSHNDYDQGGWSVDAGDFDGDGRAEQAVVWRQANRPSSYDSADYVNPTACAGYLANSGAVLLVEPGKTQPRAVFYGASNDRLEKIHATSDLNGDGFDDWVIATRQNASSQGVWVVFGRALDPDRATVLCDGTRLISAARSSNLGIAITGLGDLDGDGCDEVAVGANSDDRGRTNQGAVRVIKGWGGRTCPSEPSVIDLVPDWGSANLGTALASGDFNHDGVRDLVATATNQATPQGERGVVYLIDGASLGRQRAQPVRNGVLPTTPLVGLSTQLRPLATVQATNDFPFLGQGLAVTTEGRESILWVSSHISEVGGGQGTINAYRFTDGSLELDRVVVGPPSGVSNLFGLRMASRPGSPDLAVSAYRAPGIGVEAGEVYVWAP